MDDDLAGLHHRGGPLARLGPEVEGELPSGELTGRHRAAHVERLGRPRGPRAPRRPGGSRCRGRWRRRGRGRPRRGRCRRGRPRGCGRRSGVPSAAARRSFSAPSGSKATRAWSTSRSIAAQLILPTKPASWRSTNSRAVQGEGAWSAGRAGGPSRAGTSPARTSFQVRFKRCASSRASPTSARAESVDRPSAAPNSIGANSATSEVPLTGRAARPARRTPAPRSGASATDSSGCIAAHTRAALQDVDLRPLGRRPTALCERQHGGWSVAVGELGVGHASFYSNVRSR